MLTAKRIILLVLVAVLALAAMPTLAQTTSTSRTVTITEAQANDSYRVTHPYRRSVTDVSVDFQPGQVVISATITLRGQEPVATESTFVPEVRSGRVYWTVSAVTANGEPVSDALLNQINASIAAAWRNFVKNQAAAGRITGLTITDTDLNITLTRTR